MLEAPALSSPCTLQPVGQLQRVPQHGSCPLSLCLPIVLHAQDILFSQLSFARSVLILNEETRTTLYSQAKIGPPIHIRGDPIS